MLHTVFVDGKSRPEGAPIAMSLGVAIRKCRGMMYWLLWGNHTFDIRIMWQLLGIDEQPYFSATNKPPGEWVINEEFYTDFVSSIAEKDFNELMERHDKEMNSVDPF